ncbi:MAG: type II toxin-antitoxin system HicB family antitoxin [Solirubrobacteraceae bacterium MAG38_C4-C5]|nr:type II toxin-antitoxin system HicB family antitoxin [Candidatus Siliceabacter maunaloa]
MAKVMVSMPDDLHERLDRRARERGTSRSGLLQELTEREVSLEEGKQRRRIDELLAGTGSYDGQATVHVREMRDSR